MDSKGRIMTGQYEEIKKNAKLIAIIVRADYSAQGIKFFTPETDSQ
jgi:hypothetical protein